MKRDFTYIDDIVEGVIRIQDVIPGGSLYKIFNIGNNEPVELMSFIEAIEKATDKTAKKIYMPMQAGDVPTTFADIDSLTEEVGFNPGTNIEYGIEQFVTWFKAYYNDK